MDASLGLSELPPPRRKTWIGVYTLVEGKALLRFFFFLQTSATMTISTPPRTSMTTAPTAETAMIISRFSFTCGEEIGGGLVGGLVGELVGWLVGELVGVVAVEATGWDEGSFVGHSVICSTDNIQSSVDEGSGSS